MSETSCLRYRPRFADLSRSVILWVLLLVASGELAAQSNLLGSIDFPTSGDSSAQSHFVEGVLYLHNFEYDDAARCFQRAQEADPDFAMAIWGEAMTHNHPIWMQQDRDAALAVLARLAPTPEEREAKAPTEREKDYLRTIEVLFGAAESARDLTKEERDFLYRDEMRRLRDTYPEDFEAATFYGLSILGTAHEGRDFSVYMRAAAALIPVWDANPHHPGAAHYLIHSFDDPIHAPLGLPMARVYAKIAPAASHAQHMTSHIFVAMGMWDDVVDANVVARDVQNARLVELGESPRLCGHYTYWLEYGYLQQGRHHDAARVMDTCYKSMGDEPKTYDRWHYGAMKARYVLDTGDWNAADRWQAMFEPSDFEDIDGTFISAYAAIQRGELDAASRNLEVLKSLPAEDDAGEKKRAVLRLEIEALLELRQGEEDEAVRLLREAEAMEADMPYMFGPPDVVKPAAELLGETLLEIGHPAEALVAFEKQLDRTPGRNAALLGLARSASAAGEKSKADTAYRRLAQAWHQAELDIPAYEEVVSASGLEPKGSPNSGGPIVVQNYYWSNPGKENEVYRHRLYASEVRSDLGLVRGRVLRLAGGSGDMPDVMWECEYPSQAARDEDVERLTASGAFEPVMEHMSTLIRKFERTVWEVEPSN